MTRLRVIDLETTGMAPPSEIIEFGWTDVVVEDQHVRVGRPSAALYRPLHGIPPETMAVHHLTEADFPAELPACSMEILRSLVWRDPKPDILVAHNCEFERQFIGQAITGDAPWICTYKVALRVWPEAPKHSNQVLRYWRGLRLDPALAMPPHRAGPDTWVTAQLLAQMLGTASTDEMIVWTGEPRAMPAIPFGKHRGTSWDQLPTDYLEWMDRQLDMDADAQWHARRELARRRGGL